MEAANCTAVARSFFAALMPNAVSPRGAPLSPLAITGATPLHRGWRAGRVRQDIDQPVGRELERFAQRQGLAKRLPVHQQRQVDGELHRCACAESPTCSMRRHNCSSSGIARPTASGAPPTSAEQFALLGGPGAAADRTFHEDAALLRHRRSDRLHRVRPQRAHVDQHLACEFRRQDAFWRAIDRLRCRIIQQHHDGCFATLHQFRGRGEQFCAGIGQRLWSSPDRGSRPPLHVRPPSIAARSLIPSVPSRRRRLS